MTPESCCAAPKVRPTTRTQDTSHDPPPHFFASQRHKRQLQRCTRPCWPSPCPHHLDYDMPWTVLPEPCCATLDVWPTTRNQDTSHEPPHTHFIASQRHKRQQQHTRPPAPPAPYVDITRSAHNQQKLSTPLQETAPPPKHTIRVLQHTHTQPHTHQLRDLLQHTSATPPLPPGADLM